MPESFEDFAKRISSLPAPVAETHCRKYIASNLSDARGWRLLIKKLISKGNYSEARYTIDRFVVLHGGNNAGKRLAIEWYFQVGAARDAYRICPSLADPAVGDTGISSVINFLNSLYGSPSCSFRGDGIGTTDWIRDFNGGCLPIPPEGIDVALFLKFTWHLSIQRRIGEELRRLGLRCLFVSSVPELLATRPRAVIVSDGLGSDYSMVRHFLPRCLIVYSRHGLGDKNYAFGAAAQADVTCMSAPAAAREFANRSLIDPRRLWVTGFPQMDNLFRRLRTDVAKISHRSVLVAPTFNEHLHAGEMLGERLVELVRGNDTTVRVMIKPHPHYHRTHSNLVAAWRAQALALPNVSIYLSEETNLMDLFGEADIMLSDVSSAGLAWLATGRPLVCIANPETAEASPFFAPDGLEWRMHRAAVVVPSANALQSTIHDLLNFPQMPNESYLSLQDHLFGTLTDGQASERIAASISNWISRHT